MKPTFKIFLDERSSKRDGSYSIAIRITFKRKTTTISTGYSAFKEEWNSDSTELKKSPARDALERMRINNYLNKRKGQLSELCQRLQFEDASADLSSKELFRLVRNKSDDSELTFFKAVEDYMEQLLKDGKHTSHGHFKSTLSVLKKFVGKEKFYVKELTLDFVKNFERHYLSQKVSRHGNTPNKCLNGLAPHLRRVRAVVNSLIKQGKFTESKSPFKQYKIRTEQTYKRSLNTEQIRKILNLDLVPYTGIWNARNYFMACFYMQGASLTDLARLKVKNIMDGSIEYRRAKTKQQITVVVSPQLQNLLDYYIQAKSSNDYIFPIIKSNDAIEEQILRYVHSADIKINQHLRDLAEKAGIDNKYISTYWARHSYATNLKRRNVPHAAISESLGHRNMQTTEIYLGELDNGVIAKYNEEMFAELDR